MKELHDYRAILRGDWSIIDVRAPVEFAKGSIQAATNLPILTDSERAQVGTAHKEQGSEAARELGLALVGGEQKESRVSAWVSFVEKHEKVALCCWRGGERSEFAQQWLAERGFEVPRVAGGSKAIRQFVLDKLEGLHGRPLVVVGGLTATRKTDLINMLAASIDLEGLAVHRGSAFGRLERPQPTPITFEASLVREFCRKENQDILAIEDESRTIGRLGIPSALYTQMQGAPLVIVEAPLKERTRYIFEAYVVGQSEALLLAAVDRIRTRLGGDRHKQLRDEMCLAFRDHDAELHQQWIRKLLVWYYDAMYEYQLKRKESRIVFTGTFDEVQKFLATEYSIS